MNRNVVTAILMSGFMATSSFAGSNEGTSTANFLKLGAGARASAMGDAYTAVADDATAVTWNPAALTRVTAPAASFMHAAYVESSQYNYAAYAQPLGERSVIGAGIQHFTPGEIDGMDTNGDAAADVKPSDLAGALAYAHRTSWGALGLAGKFVRSKLVDTASTWAVDFGYLTPRYKDRFDFSLTANHVGGEMEFDEEKEDLPTVFRAGSAVHITRRWMGAYDVSFPNDGDVSHAVGTEFPLLPEGKFGLTGRLGYNTRTKDLDGAGLSGGLGFSFKKISIDYALASFGDLGLTHRFSLNFKAAFDKADRSHRQSPPSSTSRRPRL